MVFRWQFACDGADIGFGVYLKKKIGEWVKAGQMKEIVPSQRYNAHLVPEDGSLTCPEPGVCKCRDCFMKTNFLICKKMNLLIYISFLRCSAV